MYRALLLLFLSGSINALYPDVIEDVLTDVPATGQLWAIIVAGSNGWHNYRHQADVCHAYQVLHNRGMPDERIVVMMYDDLVYNKQNPTPGIVINRPNGSDVYEGVPHNYIKYEVTPQIFLNVLQGKKESVKNVGSGKVIDSGPNDHVFLYFSGHGAPGLVIFPDRLLTARELLTALNMYQQKQYGKMVIYIEASESGSMFHGLLPDSINIYATTATNPKEEAHACYYDVIQTTYLGNVYSVKWLEDSDTEVLTKETLKKQYEIVKERTKDSHVQEYGDLTISNMKVSEFQGRKDSQPIKYSKALLEAIKSREVPLEILKSKLEKTVDSTERLTLQRKIKKLQRNRYFSFKTMERIVQAATYNNSFSSYLIRKHNLVDFTCYFEAVNYFHEECFNLGKNSYVLVYLYILVNMCESKVPVTDIKNGMDRICTRPPIYGIK